VVVLTSSAEARDVQAGVRGRGELDIVKPVDFEQFVAVCERIELSTGARSIRRPISPP